MLVRNFITHQAFKFIQKILFKVSSAEKPSTNERNFNVSFFTLFCLYLSYLYILPLFILITMYIAAEAFLHYRASIIKNRVFIFIKLLLFYKIKHQKRML